MTFPGLKDTRRRPSWILIHIPAVRFMRIFSIKVLRMIVSNRSLATLLEFVGSRWSLMLSHEAWGRRQKEHTSRPQIGSGAAEICALELHN